MYIDVGLPAVYHIFSTYGGFCLSILDCLFAMGRSAGPGGDLVLLLPLHPSASFPTAHRTSAKPSREARAEAQGDTELHIFFGFV